MNRQDFYCSGEEEKNSTKFLVAKGSQVHTKGSFGTLRLKRRRFGDRFYKETDKERYPN